MSSLFLDFSCKENPTPAIVQKGVKIIQTLDSFNLYGVSFFNSTTGYIVGSKGLLLKTSDGGNSWNVINTGLNNWFKCVKMVTLDTVVCGGVDVLMKSFNGGISWDTTSFAWDSSSPTWGFNDIYCFSESSWVAVGGIDPTQFNYMYYTTNAGISWFCSNKINISPISSYLYIDSSIALVSTYNLGLSEATCKIYKTTDAGNSFNFNYAMPKKPGGIGRVMSMSSFDKVNIYAVGDRGVIVTSNNAGGSWSQLSFANDSTDLYHIISISNQELYACGAWGTVIKTTNAGQTWSYISTGTNRRFNCIVHPPGSNFLIAVGYGGTILKIYL